MSKCVLTEFYFLKLLFFSPVKGTVKTAGGASRINVAGKALRAAVLKAHAVFLGVARGGLCENSATFLCLITARGVLCSVWSVG